VSYLLDRPKPQSIKHGEDIMMRYWSTLRERQLQKEAPPSAASTKKRGLKPSDLQFIEGPILRTECQTMELLQVERKFPSYAASCGILHAQSQVESTLSVSVSKHSFERFPKVFSYQFSVLLAASHCKPLLHLDVVVDADSTWDTWPPELRSVALRLWESELETYGLRVRNFGDRGQGLDTTIGRREGDILCDLDKQFNQAKCQ
jgi:hypothetical protein